MFEILIEWNQSLILNYIVRQNTAVLSSCINIEEMDICFFLSLGLQNLLFANAVKSISLNINWRLHFLVKSQFLYVDFCFLTIII
jgi:hypothetical protein